MDTINVTLTYPQIEVIKSVLVHSIQLNNQVLNDEDLPIEVSEFLGKHSHDLEQLLDVFND